MSQNRGRLAWAILLISFIICLGSAIGFPLGVRYVIHNARVGQQALVEPQQGTPRMQRGGQGPVIALVSTSDVPGGSIITTDATAQGLLTLYAPGNEPTVVAAVQIYNDTTLTLIGARSPRFRASTLPHQVTLAMTAGRARITVSAAQGRHTTVEIRTPHMAATLSEGSYEARVDPTASELAVRDGEATVSTNGGPTVSLGASQRTIVRTGATTLPTLPAERNLLTNGRFDAPLGTEWEVYHKDVQQAPAGNVMATTYNGRSTARFSRTGEGHAEVGIRQAVNYDVRDFTSLVLNLNVQVLNQSLPGCGSLGSECPIMVRIDYKDVEGTDRSWYHGFYAVPAAAGDLLPYWDQQIPGQTWYTFESGNLVEEFERPPAQIRTVWIYASGWSFDALVTDIELLAQE